MLFIGLCVDELMMIKYKHLSGLKIRFIVTVYRFRVKDKEGIKDQKSSLKMLIFPNNCQFGS